MAFSKLFGIFTYSEDLTGFKEKALMSSGLRKGLVAMAVLGCCSGGTIAAACSNTRVNSEVTEKIEQLQKSKEEKIVEICAEKIAGNKLGDDVKQLCSTYIKQHPEFKILENKTDSPTVIVLR